MQQLITYVECYSHSTLKRFGLYFVRFHQVRSFDRNIAVNVWWKHKTGFIPQDCVMEPNQTLDKFVFSSLKQETNNETEPDLM